MVEGVLPAPTGQHPFAVTQATKCSSDRFTITVLRRCPKRISLYLIYHIMFLWQIREIKNRGRNRSAQHRKERNGRLKIYSVLKIGINLGLLLLIALRSVQIVLILFYLGVWLCGRSADLLFCCVFSANLYVVWGNT
jgi:hypothetical protein